MAYLGNPFIIEVQYTFPYFTLNQIQRGYGQTDGITEKPGPCIQFLISVVPCVLIWGKRGTVDFRPNHEVKSQVLVTLRKQIMKGILP